jgi:acyl-homoserine lactone acylase PvdQ
MEVTDQLHALSDLPPEKGDWVGSIRLEVLYRLTGLFPVAAASSPRASCVAGWPTCGERRSCPAEPLPQRPDPGRGLVAAACNNSKSRVALVSRHSLNYIKLNDKLHSPGSLQQMPSEKRIRPV